MPDQAMTVNCQKKRRGFAVFLIISLIFLAACSEGEREGAGENGEAGLPSKEVVLYPELVSQFRVKADKLQRQAVTEEIYQELGVSPAGEAGDVVFFSVCDTARRARVYSGTGATLEEAWERAEKRAEGDIGANGLVPTWVKADIVYVSEPVGAQALFSGLRDSRPGYFRYGLAFDPFYETALLEAELNGAQIYEYGDGGVDFDVLNRYLEETGKPALDVLPEDYILFQCFGWLCDENSQVTFLSSSGSGYGGRKAETVDGACAKDMVSHAAAYLAGQVKEDGSFAYGRYPQWDREIEGYNIVRHAGSSWALTCHYRMSPSEGLAKAIQKSLDYMVGQIVYDEEGRAYLYESGEEEIKLGACGLAVVALAEYMEVFQSDQYVEVCRALGDGILTMLDQGTGKYFHVLNPDFSRKEEFRTQYYDGEATYALCRLYGLTGEEIWLEAAKSAVGHFIRADYTKYCDQWVAYTMNEITKYVPDNPQYYIFALQNVQDNQKDMYQQDTTYYTYLELLMATFELYGRMVENADVEGFDEGSFLKTIYARASHMRNGYFYPEYAMYMKNPQSILHTFMVRQEGFRVRIDDVHHNINGYYLYYRDYDKLVDYGMLEYKD
ncbi:MAG: hypothetical protein HFG61_08440 [Lachnospiraceae bacterium]|nr:hypothetical protein [Lachnospiraceae bacterium]